MKSQKPCGAAPDWHWEETRQLNQTTILDGVLWLKWIYYDSLAELNEVSDSKKWLFTLLSYFTGLVSKFKMLEESSKFLEKFRTTKDLVIPCWQLANIVQHKCLQKGKAAFPLSVPTEKHSGL